MKKNYRLSGLAIWMSFAYIIITSTSQNASAQSARTKDSLITEKKEFKKDEQIRFAVKLDTIQKINPNHFRSVQTMSCSCDDKDFYYVVYRIADLNNTGNRKVFLNHTEGPETIRCECKTHFAVFYENKEYFIPPINEKGNYQVVIEGNRCIMVSNVFTVSE